MRIACPHCGAGLLFTTSTWSHAKCPKCAKLIPNPMPPEAGKPSDCGDDLLFASKCVRWGMGCCGHVLIFGGICAVLGSLGGPRWGAALVAIGGGVLIGLGALLIGIGVWLGRAGPVLTRALPPITAGVDGTDEPQAAPASERPTRQPQAAATPS